MPHRPDAEEEDLQPFEGWTFATDRDGDLRMTEMNRFAVAHDLRALRQVLLTALGTVETEDPIDPEFGFDVFDATISIPHLKREVRRTLLYDDKVHDRVVAVPVVNVTLMQDRHAHVHVEAEIDSGDLQSWDINIPWVF